MCVCVCVCVCVRACVRACVRESSDVFAGEICFEQVSPNLTIGLLAIATRLII